MKSGLDASPVSGKAAALAAAGTFDESADMEECRGDGIATYGGPREHGFTRFVEGRHVKKRVTGTALRPRNADCQCPKVLNCTLP